MFRLVVQPNLAIFAPVIETRVSQCLVWLAQRFFNLCKQQQDTYYNKVREG